MLPSKNDWECPPLYSGHSSGKMIDAYAKEQSRRALLFCFFTGGDGEENCILLTSFSTG